MTLSPPAFWLHRLALEPARPGASAETLGRALEPARGGGEAAFAAFLLDHGLGPLWHEALHRRGAQDLAGPATLEALKEARMAAALLYMQQSAALRQIDRLFASQGIAYAATKGSQVRELAYPDPALRPACDIDILVPPRQRVAAAEALAGAGFGYRPEPDTISHEASFRKGGVEIDLHWDIFRPGRTRAALADSLVARRRRVNGEFWALDDADAVFLMLTHPVFVKYVCSPAMALCGVADFMLWTARRGADWGAVAARLDEAGLKTAAWTVLRWFGMLGAAAPGDFMAAIRPGAARARYLDHWLEHDLPTRWLERRALLIQLGLTLPAHDRPRDAGRAVRGWLLARLSQHRDPFAHLHADGAGP